MLELIYWVARAGFHTFSFLFFPRTVYGAHHLPAKGGFIVACNHISNLDPFIVGLSSRRRKLSFMAKESLFRHKVISTIFYGMKAYPINRDSSDLRSFRTTLAILKRGEGVVLFPEGTRRREGVDPVIKAGIGFLAAKAKVPVIPVFLEGSDRVLPPGCRFPRRRRVIVRFGPPVAISSSRDYRLMSQEIMDAVYQLAPDASPR